MDNKFHMKINQQKHWSKIEYLHQNVTNPNIHIEGTHSYYSDAWTGSFEETVVRGASRKPQKFPDSF